MPFISDEDLKSRLESSLNLRLPSNTGIETPNNSGVGMPSNTGTGIGMPAPSADSEDNNSPDEDFSYPEPNINYEEITNGKEGIGRVPLELRKTFSVLNKVNGETAPEIAKVFDVSRNTVERSMSSHITNSEGKGELSAFNEKIERKIDDKRADAEGKAVDTLLQALNIIPQELGKQKFSTQVSTAKTMADIANMMGKRGQDKEATVHFYIMAPPMKKLKDYEVIDAELSND